MLPIVFDIVLDSIHDNIVFITCSTLNVDVCQKNLKTFLIEKNKKISISRRIANEKKN